MVRKASRQSYYSCSANNASKNFSRRVTWVINRHEPGLSHGESMILARELGADISISVICLVSRWETTNTPPQHWRISQHATNGVELSCSYSQPRITQEFEVLESGLLACSLESPCSLYWPPIYRRLITAVMLPHSQYRCIFEASLLHARRCSQLHE